MGKGHILLLALMLVSAGLAGCLGGQPTTEAGDGPAGPSGTGTAEAGPGILQLTECSEQYAYLPVAVDEVEMHIPDDFKVRSLDPAGTTTYLYLVALDCQDGAGTAPIGSVWVSAWVEPPQRYQVRDVNFYLVPIKVFVEGEPALADLESWGLGQAVEAEVSLEASGADGARVGIIEAVGGGDRVRMHSQTTGPTADVSAFTYRVFGVEGGKVTTAVEIQEGGSTFAEGGIVSLENTLVQADKRAGGVAHYWGMDVELRPIELPGADSTTDTDGAVPGPRELSARAVGVDRR